MTLTLAMALAVLIPLLPLAYVISSGLPESMRALALWQLRKAHVLARLLLRKSRAMESWRLQRDRQVRKALAEELS